jgi:uncharacterized Zn-finger protein
MIIIGTRVRRSVIGVKPFYCPTCQTERNYVHEEAKRWGTLFFIPIIPLDKVGEVVTCQHCGTQYRPEVLNLQYNKAKRQMPTDE